MKFNINNVLKYCCIYYLCIISFTCYAEVKLSMEKAGVILLGDTGENGANQTAVANAIAKFCTKNLCSFGLLLGDNIYQDGVQNVKDPQFQTKFENAYGDLKFKFYPVLGNHDARGNWQAEIDYKSDHWYMDGRYYLINVDWLTIYALDTNLLIDLQMNPQNTAAKRQLEWFDKQLSKHPNSWKFVYGHHPIYSSGMHGDTEAVKLFLEPIIKQHAVNFYASGHDHDLELIQKDKVHYIVSGAGARTRDITPSAKSTFAISGLGFAYLSITPDSALLQFINQHGKILYQQHIDRN